MKKRGVRVLLGLFGLVAALLVWNRVRVWTRSAPPRPDEAAFAHRERVTILRDRWGVPHVYGKSDADAAFGLAYANAEDDWPLMQAVLAASTGRLSLLFATKQALANDYYVALVRVREQVDEQYDQLSPEYRAVLEGYARGLWYYAYTHPEESDGRLFPISGRDVAAGFAHKVPLMFDLPKVLGALLDGPPRHAGERLFAELPAEERTFPGSNAHAVAASRSTDGLTRLNINSHQPWEGPVTWYEAQVVSEEGWNMTGGVFPGAPVILHGHNQHLGWAHTVNYPDLVDVYELRRAPVGGDAYVFEGGTKPIERKAAPLTLDTGLVTITLHKDVLWSEHGPVLETDHGLYAIRYAGMGRALQSGEQWYRMNKAKNLAEWKAAMSMQAIPMFNTVYADASNIFYVYNAALPVRHGAHDYQAILPGDRADALWTEVVPFSSLPQVENPASGFVQSCNSTPFSTTTGAGNPDPAGFAANAGIGDPLTNRARRSLALLGTGAPISREDFLAMKWDRRYDEGSALVRDVIAPLRALAPANDQEREALALVAGWDLVADEGSEAATIALLTWRRGGKDVAADFRDTLSWLEKHHGSIRVPWGKVQRLRRGTVDLALGGGNDVMNAVIAREEGGHLVGQQGDSLVVVVELGKDGTRSSSVHQYGNSNRRTSPHYADQAPLLLRHELKPTLRTRAEVEANLERAYSP
jgi:penicillin amidase/acyl-homoserine-lactone acylase